MADALRKAVGNEWAAVAYFYAAYHAVRAALLADPIFRDPARLAPLGMTPDDSRVSSHNSSFKTVNGHRERTRWGLNDLVFQLYRPISTTYVNLHSASVEVRYDRGLRLSLDDIHRGWESFKADVASGALVTSR